MAPAVESFRSALEPNPQVNQAGGWPGLGLRGAINAHKSALPLALVRGTGGALVGRE